MFLCEVVQQVGQPYSGNPQHETAAVALQDQLLSLIENTPHRERLICYCIGRKQGLGAFFKFRIFLQS